MSNVWIADYVKSRLRQPIFTGLWIWVRTSGRASKLWSSVQLLRAASWLSQGDTADFQFFLEILGASAQQYSVGGFFNIMIPCLSNFNAGTRDLVLALVATQRSLLAPRGSSHSSANIHALERFNKALKHLPQRSATTPSEVLQASCILLSMLVQSATRSKSCCN